MLKVGDVVKVYRRVKWEGWQPAMDASVGKEYKVVGEAVLYIKLSTGFYYPKYTLKKVGKK